jgi:aminopeptidase
MGTTTGTVEHGARQVVHNCLRIPEGAKVVLVTDTATREVATAIEKVATDAGAEVLVFNMEDFGDRPETPSEETPALAFPDEIADAMRGAQFSIYAAGGRAGEYKSFRNPMVELMKELKLRHGHMPTISVPIMESAMCADYSLVQRLSARVWGLLYGSKSAHLTTPAGTDLEVTFSPDMKWVVDDGAMRPGKLGNLPAGEVFTAMLTANGKLVVDGFIGDYFDKIPTDPIFMEVKDGRVVLDSITSDDTEMVASLREYYSQDENANRFGEFAVGTNPAAKTDRGLLEGEKHLTVHMATGHPYCEETGADWDSETHLDVLVVKPTLILGDGTVIFQDGELNPAIMDGLT